MAGLPYGTVDVVVSARYDEDMITCISEYPGLHYVKDEISILPQWIRPENRIAESYAP
jgi:hypothetical protein